MKTRKAIAGVLGVTVSSLFALSYVLPVRAETPMTPTVPSSEYERLDRNLNVAISKDEAGDNQALLDPWKDVDINKDGVISRGEFARFEEQSQTDPVE